MTFDAVHGTLEGVNIAKTEYLAIAWTAESLYIILIYDRSSVIFDLTCEKLIESTELIDVFDFYLSEIHSI